MPNIYIIIKYKAVIFALKYLNKMLPVPLRSILEIRNPVVDTRNRNMFIVPFTRLNYRKKTQLGSMYLKFGTSSVSIAS